MRSGRKIAAACESDTAFMFLAAMYKPDFRTINDFRKDNIDFIQKAFIHIVQLCKGLGMCKAGTLIIDSTKLKANASAERSKTKQQYQQWVERIDTDIKNILDEAAQTDAEEDKQYGEKRGDELPEVLRSKQKLKEKIKEVLEQMNGDKERINLTDKEAKFIKSNGKIDVNYSCQTAISEDGIIVSAYTSNCSSDRTDTIKTVNNAELNTEENYKEILADSGYASFDNFEELDKRNKIIYIPDQQMNTEADKEQNPYHRNHFIYNEQKDCFVCPENKELPFYSNIIHRRTKQQSKVYKCKECPACDKQNLCVKGKYREIHIEKREHLRQEIRERLNSAEGNLKYLKRMRIESVFGNIKHNLNYIHLYLKGIKKTTAEWQLICIGHNLKKIHKLKMT
jgi:transposase